MKKLEIIRTKEDFEKLSESSFFDGAIEANRRDMYNPYREKIKELSSFFYIIVEYEIVNVGRHAKSVLLNQELLDLWDDAFPKLGM